VFIFSFSQDPIPVVKNSVDRQCRPCALYRSSNKRDVEERESERERYLTRVDGRQTFPATTFNND
jgi:hypothetical protein